MTIAELRIGDNGIVRQIHGNDDCIIRLMEMGLTLGTTVLLNRVAPLGDPLHLTLRGYHLSIRRSEAARIDIDLVS
ncbi:MAG: iron transporter FeoA [Acidobacteria bacterium RBG_16_68_9]|nr:MAG: iron transporter FeoA [Acidobacteria bacterium RBG_16_68_9]